MAQHSFETLGQEEPKVKRILLYAIILIALLAAPVESMNVGELIPIEAVSIYKEAGTFIMETDTGNSGKGETVALALQNLKDTASGRIYLDTARYLLVMGDAQEEVQQLRPLLRRSVKLAVMGQPVEMESVAKFLDAHDGLPKLKHWKYDIELPVLSGGKDSFIFLKKVENNA